MVTTVEFIWDQYQRIVIRDVHEKWHERVRNFMYENYFKPNRIFQQLEFQDDPQVNNEYLKYVEHILNDECSVIALHEQTDQIYAVALVKCMTKDWRSWTALQICIDSCKFTDIMELQYRMINQYADENPDRPFDSLHLFEYFVIDEVRNNSEFMSKFFYGITETARHMKMPRVTYLALGAAEQEECYEQGFNMLSFAIYSVFTLHAQRPFVKLRDIEEMEAVLYEMEVEPLIPYYEMNVRGIDDVVQVKEVDKRQSVAPPKRQGSIQSADE